MRKFVLTIVVFSALATFGTRHYLSAQQQTEQSVQPLALKGYYTHEPWNGGTRADAAFQAAAGTTIPLFNYSITSTKDNTLRSGTMVGTSPFAATKTGTTISTVIVPLKVTIGSAVFDPTSGNSCDSGISTLSRFTSSPLVSNVANLTINGQNVGTTQFINGFRRAEFWNTIGGSAAYQNTLSFTTAALSSVTAGSHGTTYSSGCSQLGIVSYTWLSNYLKNTLIPSLMSSGVISTSKFVVFLLRNVVQSDVDPPSVNSCCILGFHGATGNPVLTYSPMDWDTTGLFSGTADGSVSSHEIGEWMDDPLGTNPTAAWGHVGQVSGCQTNLENGDPLSGKLMPTYTLGGKAFHMQELGFFSWYFNKNGVASSGTGGKFSSNGTFAGPSKPARRAGRTSFQACGVGIWA